MNYWSELEQEPFDSEEFVERLAWRSASSSTSSEFNAEVLNDAFVSAIRELSSFAEKQRIKCEALETKTREEESEHRKRIVNLIERNKVSATTYRSLDEKINSVATKVVHLGDQLQSVNIPRSRDVEALKLIKYFDEFLDSENALSSIFTDKAKLHEAADVIIKLQCISMDLPPEKFDDAIRRIDKKYCEIERSLLEEFIKSHRSNDIGRMKDLAGILFHFKGYTHCVDAFIEQIQLKNQRSSDIFKDIVPLCEKSWKLITQIFPHSQQVMSKFVLNVYHSTLKDYIQSQLSENSEPKVFLETLFTLYSKTTLLTNELSRFNYGGKDHILFLSNVRKNIFQSYLEDYIRIESRFLNEEAKSILSRYYEAKGHTKKILGNNALTLQDLKRDIHGFIVSKANITLDSASSSTFSAFSLTSSSTQGNETFLSEEVAITLIQLTKTAFRRCQVLSESKDLANNANEIFNILISYLIHEHIDYACDIGLQGIPHHESKVISDLYFFDVIGQTNAIIHLLEKQFNDSLIPLVVSSPRHTEVVNKKKNELEKLEVKLDIGCERSLAALLGWIKGLLMSEQKKSDFNSSEFLATASSACLRVTRFILSQIDKIKNSLDGQNIECVLKEFGIRFHRILFEHLSSFTYSSTGAMTVICDVKEYRECVNSFKVNFVTSLFDTLHSMCNLLILPPENLKSALSGDSLASLDRVVLDNWIQLRADYKTEKLGSLYYY